MQKLPPYGRTLTTSQDVVWIFAGEHRHIFDHVKHHKPDTIGIFYWEDPQSYRWPLQGRTVIVFCRYSIDEYFKEYRKDQSYLKRLALTLFMGGAKDVYIFNMATYTTQHYSRS